MTGESRVEALCGGYVVRCEPALLVVSVDDWHSDFSEDAVGVQYAARGKIDFTALLDD
jgi:hypothetical protein